MIAAPGAARLREHEDALVVVHERLRLGEVSRTGAVLDKEPLALAHDAARAACHLGHHVGSEALDDLVERAMHRRQRSKLLDQPIAARDRFAAFDGLAIAIDWARRQVSLAVGEGLVELHRKGVGEIAQHIFPRRDVDPHIAPFLGWDLGQPALHQRFACRDDLDDRGVALVEIAVDGGDQRWRLHAGDQVREKALLGALEG